MNQAVGATTPNDDKPKIFFERPLHVIGTVLGVAIGLLVALYFLVGIPNNSIQMEIAKALLQVGVVAVGGALLKLVADEHSRRASKADKAHEIAEDVRVRAIEAEKIELRYREELLKDTLNRITASYNQAKRARRRMRALGLNRSETSDERMILSRYDECMAEVNDAQLELESIVKDVATNEEAFPSAKRIRSALTSMERYLDELNGEYVNKRPHAGPKMSDVPFSKMDWIKDFLGKAKVLDAEGKKVQSKFKSNFAMRHLHAREAINRDLLALTSAKRALS
jgi:hypothetical protein